MIDITCIMHDYLTSTGAIIWPSLHHWSNSLQERQGCCYVNIASYNIVWCILEQVFLEYLSC